MIKSAAFIKRTGVAIVLLLFPLAGAASALAIDATVFGDRSTLSASISTSPFSTNSPNELLLAFISSDSLGTTVQVNGVSGASLTWVLVSRANAQLGTAEIWRAFAPSLLSGVSVTATLSQSVAASITVVTFTGVDTSGTNGSGAVGAVASASGSTGAPTATLVTTRANSWVFGVGTDWDSATPRIVGPNQVLVHQYPATVGDMYWVQRQNSVTPAQGTSVTIDDTAPASDRWDLAICEIKAGSAATYVLSGTISPAVSGSGALVTLGGGATQTATADSTGGYGFANLTSGTYTVTPTKSGFSFTPARQTVTISTGDQTAVNFTAAVVTGNPIVVENSKTGTSNWQLTNPSYNGEIEGYAGATSVNRGATIALYVNSNGAPLTLDLYRLGWYQGLGARLMASAGSLPGQAQPACPQDPTYGLIECKWTPTVSVNVDPTWTTGVYMAKVRRSDTGKDNYITFVVRDDASASDILFDSNVNTMQAYNGWGGKALYAGLSSPPQPTRSVSNAAVKVSFDRPYKAYDFFGSTDGEDTQFLRWEYQMVRWLESQGFDVSYSTNIDTGLNGSLLLHHRLYLAAGHGEYWPSSMRNNVEAAMNAGVNLAFFAANSSYWQVRFESSSSGIPNRVMVGYKESASTYDPLVSDSTQSTSRFRDSYIGRPENSFLGSMWGDVTGTANGFPFVVSNSSHPFYRNTGLANGSSMPGLVGDEWDNTTGLGASNIPPGIQDLIVLSNSPTSGSTHTAVVHQAPSGALVFNVGTFQWSWGLDNTLTPIVALDSRVGQITANILVDLGATPQTPLNVTISPTFAISGTISALSGPAIVTLTGAASRQTTTDAQGNYIFKILSNGVYTVTPTRSGASFNPVSRSVTISGGDATNVNFAQSVPTWSISGTISPASSGANTTVQLSGAASAMTTTLSTGDYSFTTVANGQYTVTPGKAGFTFTPASQTVTVNGADVPSVNFTAQPATSSGLAIDVVTSSDRSSASPSIASSAFSLSSGNELLLAFISADSTGSAVQVTNVTGASLTWVLVGRANAQLGTAEIWRAYTPARLSSVTVTASLSQSVAASMTVVTFIGADPSGTSGSGAVGAVASRSDPSGAPTASLLTTRSNSWVVGVGTDWDSATSRTLGSSQTMVHQYLATIGDTYWVQRLTSPTPLAGTTVTMNDTSPTSDRFNLIICEVLQAP